MTRPDNQQWEFGSFRLDGAQHLLFRDGKIVPLSRKAMDMLIVLLEHQGQLVEKDVLMRRVWPDSFVEESNLAVHISQLRKILSGEDAICRIETVPRRGYRLVGSFAEEAPPAPEPVAAIATQPSAVTPRWRLPAAVIAVILLGVAGVALFLHHRAANIRHASQIRLDNAARERFAREGHHYQFAAGDLVRAEAVYENWASAYPEDITPHTQLAIIDSDLGKFVASLDHAKIALRLAPGDAGNYTSLASRYLSFDHLNLARDVINRAVAQKLDSADLHLYLYDIAFLQRDDAGMEQQMTWAASHRDSEAPFLGHYANTLAFEGKNAKATEFIGRAIEAARHAGKNETAAGYALDAAQREALFGNTAEATRLAIEALALAHDRDTKYGAALALALAGSVAPANTIVDQLNNDFPDDTFVQYLYLPTIRAAVALNQKDPARAAQVLEASTPYELGVASGLVPVYVRGLAYLAYGDSARAEDEFEKVIANPGVVLNSPIGPLSRLQLARAYALEGDRIHAKASYQDFLSRWKDADPDLPILRVAQAEYAKQ